MRSASSLRDPPRGHQQIERVGVADDARQHPADAVLGDQPAARERGGEDGIVGGKTQVAIERVDEADAGGGAVQHADHGFRDRRIIGVARLPVRPAVHVERRRAFAAPDLVGIDAFQRLHIGAGAERATGAGEHDDADIVVGGRRLHRVAHVALHGRGPRIHAVRPVERDGRDLVAHLVENMLIGHRDLPVVSVIDFLRASHSAAPDQANDTITFGNFERCSNTRAKFRVAAIPRRPA